MEKIRVENVSYSYQNQYQKIEAVKEVSCSFEAGNMYAITGESGSGKSTFLSLLAGLDRPESGTILVEGEISWKWTGMLTGENRFPWSIRHFTCFLF